jgi:hypothetical protein
MWLGQGVIAVNEEHYDRVAAKAERLAGSSLEPATVRRAGFVYEAIGLR